MGKVFPGIADAVLKAHDTTRERCPACEKPAQVLYPASGELIGCGERDGQTCHEVCAACLKAGRVEHVSEWRTDDIIRAYVQTQVKPAARRRKVEAALKAELRSTPRFARFAQGDDWPLCCERVTEFRGSPRSLRALIRLSRSATYWEQRVVAPCPYDFETDGEPESLREVSIFKCAQCATEHWVFQFT